MRIVDKNGKLFGIINIMDIIIILLVILIGVTFYNKLNNKGDSSVSSTKHEIYIVAEAHNQAPDITESIKKGDTLVAQNIYQNGEIDYVNITDDNYVTTTKEGKLILEKRTDKKKIEVGINCAANINGPYIESGGQEIKVGKSYWIKTSKGQIRGYIKEIKLEQ